MYPGLDRSAKYLVTGASGMVGSATIRLMRQQGFERVLAPSREQLDLLDQQKVFTYFEMNRPDYVFMVAAKVGGIAANSADPVGFLDENMRLTLNLFAACHRFAVRKSLFLGSSCIYPKHSPQPMKEEYIMTGPLEPTNEGYALAKIAGLRLAHYYDRQHGMDVVCPMPCNIYGTGDHFDLQRSHVLSALVRRFVDGRDGGASAITLWGTGAARREFAHVDDIALSLLFFLESVHTSDHMNVGPGIDITVRDLALLIARKVGYQGEIRWDSTKPDGMLRKCLDVTRLRELGFALQVNLEVGIERTIAEYERLKREGALEK